ncbi:hypothetical protein WBK31_12110 [Nonomuraea sp. N2-4H]|uniref:hypothetical protein n=1 Tax=Nonomuraea sp. N2-4H TaxID=3128898 RepID=UPI003254A1AD
MPPLNAATLIIDCTGLPAVLTGPRSAATPAGEVAWRQGVAVGLTPAGMRALTGMAPKRLFALVQDIVPPPAQRA